MSLIPARSHSSVLAVLTAGILYLFAGGFYVEHGLLNADEGFYAYASYAVMHGRVPYRDFGYTQPPVLPYLQGAIMTFTGFGVRQERWINVCLGALSVALGVALLGRFKFHPLPGWSIILAWCLCKPLVYYDTIGKTYALAGLLLLAAGGCLYLNLSPHLKLFLLSLLGVLAVGCRLTVGPAVLILWIGLVVMHRKQISWLLLLGVPLLTALVILGPFFAADPPNTVFWTWTTHMGQLQPEHGRGSTLLASFGMVPGVTVVVVIGLCVLAFGRESMNTPGAWLLLAGFADWLLSVGFSGVYTDYCIPCMPLVLIGGGLLLCAIYPIERKMTGVCVVSMAVTIAGIIYGDSFARKGYLEAIDRAVGYVKANTKATDSILTSMPEIPLAAGRPISPGFEMGKFSITNDMDDSTAKSRNFVTFNRLLVLIYQQSAPVIVLSNFHTGNFAWSVPSCRTFSPESYLILANLLLQRYDCVYANPYFLVFKIHDPQNHALKIDAHQL